MIFAELYFLYPINIVFDRIIIMYLQKPLSTWSFEFEKRKNEKRRVSKLLGFIFLVRRFLRYEFLRRILPFEPIGIEFVSVVLTQVEYVIDYHDT